MTTGEHRVPPMPPPPSSPSGTHSPAELSDSTRVPLKWLIAAAVAFAGVLGLAAGGAAATGAKSRQLDEVVEATRALSDSVDDLRRQQSTNTSDLRVNEAKWEENERRWNKIAGNLETIAEDIRDLRNRGRDGNRRR